MRLLEKEKHDKNTDQPENIDFQDAGKFVVETSRAPWLVQAVNDIQDQIDRY